MLQSLATLMFAFAALAAAGLVGILIRADWDTIHAVLGLDEPRRAVSLPPRMRTLPARRATMIELNPRALRRAA